MEHENSEAQFKVEYTRIGPVTFNITVITPDGTKFTTVGQANPDQLTKESILQNFRDRNNWDKWICELEEIKPIIKEEIVCVETEKPIENLPTNSTPEIPLSAVDIQESNAKPVAPILDSNITATIVEEKDTSGAAL